MSNKRKWHKGKLAKGQPAPDPKDAEGGKEPSNANVYIESGIQIDLVKDLKEQYKAEHDETTAHNKKQLFWTKIAALLVAIYAFLTWWQGSSTKDAANAAKEAASIADRTMKIDQRAWIECVAVINKGSITVNQPLAGDVKFGNIGKTPANHIAVDASLVVVPKDGGYNFDYRPSAGMTGGVAFPNETPVDMPVTTLTISDGRAVRRPLSPEEVASLNAGDSFAILYVSATYVDIFGIGHWTHRCVWTSFNEGNEVIFPARKCTDYNGQDSN